MENGPDTLLDAVLLICLRKNTGVFLPKPLTLLDILDTMKEGQWSVANNINTCDILKMINENNSLFNINNELITLSDKGALSANNVFWY